MSLPPPVRAFARGRLPFVPPVVRRTTRAHRTLAAVAAVAALAACSGGGGNAGTARAIPSVPGARVATPADVTQQAIRSKIKHLIVVVLENRSFDNMMQFYDHSKADIANISGTATYHGMPVTLTPKTLTLSMNGTGHSHDAFLADYDGGKNDGFTSYGYSYVPQVEVQPYLDIAKEFAISDRFFHGITGPTFPSHLEIGGASTYGVIDNPATNTWGCDSPPGTQVAVFDPTMPNEQNPNGPFPCFEQLSIFDLMDRVQPVPVSWRFYDEIPGASAVGNLNFAGYFRHIRFGPDWTTDIARSDTQFTADAQAGTLKQVSFVIPNECCTDGAGTPSMGPNYIAQLVNAFGASTYYKDSLMMITWDDWGGMYDHVVPPVRADGSHLSFRKPILFVGAYVKHGFVSHVQTEDASIDTTIENLFGLGTLGAHDAQAADFADVLDVAQTPPAFAPITFSRYALRCQCRGMRSPRRANRSTVMCLMRRGAFGLLPAQHTPASCRW